MNSFFDTQTEGARVYRSIAPETILTECNEDFILPDYLPEIRKFLRLDADCVPSGSFIGTDAVEFGGRVNYTLYYADADGRPTAVPLHSDYEYRVPLGEGRPVSVGTHEAVETATCRPSGPRKISIRSRVRATPRVYAAVALGEDIDSLLPADAGEIERLRRRRESLCRHSFSSGEQTAEIGLVLDGVSAESVRHVATRCHATIESARAAEGRVECRGSLSFRFLGERDGELFVEVRRLPLECEIPAEGVTAEDTVFAYCYVDGATSELHPTEDGCEILFDAVYTVTADALRNEVLDLCTDAYSTAFPLRIEKKEAVTERLAASAYGLFTVDGRVECREEEEMGEVLDTTVTVLSSTLSLLPRRILISGEARASMLIAKENGGCGATDATFPFRIECELSHEVAAEDACAYTLSPLFAEGKREANGYTCTVTLALSAIVTHKSYDALPVRIERDESTQYPRDGAYRVYYPTEGDTLWRIGKKYGVPLCSLSEENEIPCEDTRDADSRQSIDGYPWLSIPVL